MASGSFSHRFVLGRLHCRGLLEIFALHVHELARHCVDRSRLRCGRQHRRSRVRSGIGPAERNDTGCADGYSEEACPAGNPQLASQTRRRTQVAELGVKIRIGLQDFLPIYQHRTPQLLTGSRGVITLQNIRDNGQAAGDFAFPLQYIMASTTVNP
jgi:hypothetical protein